MTNIEKREPLYYKTLTLKSENISVIVKEKAPWDEGSIQIYHSPTKWDITQGTIVLKDSKALDEYIDTLQQFRDTYAEEIRQLTQRKK